jgi:Fe2+ transport system protein B
MYICRHCLFIMHGYYSTCLNVIASKYYIMLTLIGLTKVLVRKLCMRQTRRISIRVCICTHMCTCVRIYTHIYSCIHEYLVIATNSTMKIFTSISFLPAHPPEKAVVRNMSFFRNNYDSPAA